ncbi:hypothetical protein FQR65_LT07591 [Abscondita terminalis]|nr:hypothetical protein FQR65_LT07591 [Abscondita terminalis]
MITPVLGVSLLAIVCLTYHRSLAYPTQVVRDAEPEVDSLWIMSALLQDNVESLNRKRRQATTPTTTIQTTRTTVTTSTQQQSLLHQHRHHHS